MGNALLYLTPNFDRSNSPERDLQKKCYLIMDFYLNTKNTYQRLLREYTEHRSLVVAYDFDNTVYDFHKNGWQFEKVIQLLKDLKSVGCYLIIFTANEDTAVSYTHLTLPTTPYV